MKPEESRSLRVLLVDDHHIVRAGLRTIISRAGIEVVGEAGTVAAAIEDAARLEPDLVLMDVRLPDGSGVTACREIRAANPRIRVLFLSAFEDDSALIATAFASAGGYLLKEIGADHLIQAIRTVASGLSVLGPSVVHTVLGRLRILGAGGEHNPGGDPLSHQERRVLALVADGKTNKEIAAEMGLSPKTVKNYLSNVFEKLQVSRRSEAVARIIRGT
jgi:two-component system, NarL family, response regulator DevR